MTMRSIPRLVIAGVSSGVGKTTVTVALARALVHAGLRVAMFKCGPDYLDPTYHRLATGRASHNLDGFMMGRRAVVETFARESDGADIALVEGVMGLFDGLSPESNEGSSAELARWLGAPILLVVDAAGMARSVAPLAAGFARFDPDVHVAGVFANRVGSAGHLALLQRAACEPPIVGGMVRAPAHAFPSRHLGLHDAEHATTVEALDRLAAQLTETSSTEALLAIAQAAPALALPAETHVPTARPCRIAIARDEAFSFYYPYNLRLLERLGATLVPFSPLRDAALPDVDGLYLGGGYPELHAAALSRNETMRASLRKAAQRGLPIYAECGGLMYLSEAIITLDGTRHALAGVIRGRAVMQPKLEALGYVEVETAARTVLGEAGLTFRGHQFRYSRLEGAQEPTLYRLRTRREPSGVVEGHGDANVLASYVHAHWASCPEAAEGFVARCAARAK